MGHRDYFEGRLLCQTAEEGEVRGYSGFIFRAVDAPSYSLILFLLVTVKHEQWGGGSPRTDPVLKNTQPKSAIQLLKASI